jgi:alpha-1,3-rhamnosyl/mannosyltransferase
VRRPLVAIDARGYFTRGGVGRYTRNLVDHLLTTARRELSFRLLISNRHRPEDLVLPPGTSADVVVSRATWQDSDQENRYLADEVTGVDLFHSLTGQWVPVVTPAVSTIHDVTPLVCPALIADPIRAMFERICRGLPRSRAVIADSHHTARDLVRLLDVDPERITTVHAAVDDCFVARPPDWAALASFGVEPDGFFLAVGVTAPHKNLLGLLRAYAASSASSPLIIVAASGPGADVAREAVDRLRLADRVRVVPAPGDEKLASLYGACRGFIYPSFYEGFGLPVLEAMACGAPVICSDNSSLPEVAGESALFVAADRGDEIAGAIRTLDADADLRARLRASGPPQAARFSWPRAARQTIGVYQRVLRDAA